MQDNFDDKSIAMELRYIKEKLKIIDDYLIVPDSIKPEKILFKHRRKSNFKRIAAVAATFVVFISMTAMIILRYFDPSNMSPDPGKNSGTIIAPSKDYVIKNKIDNDDDLKMAYFKLINSIDNDVSYVQGDSYIIPDVNTDKNTGDTFKTDGDYIYTLSSEDEVSAENSTLVDETKTRVDIISTLNRGEMKVVGSIDIDGKALEMYLLNNKLIIITKPEPYYIDLVNDNIVSMKEFNDLFDEFCKNSVKTNDDEMIREFYKGYQYENRTQVLIYDVNDVNNPLLTRQFTQDGYYSFSKLIDEDFYLITNKYDYTKNYDNLEDINPINILPFTNDSKFGGKNEHINLSDITVFSNPNKYEYTVISGFNLSNNEKPVTKACLGGVGQAYSGLNSIYFTSTDYNNVNDNISSTNIIKYSLDNGVPKLQAIGQVPGEVSNKSLLDEYGNYFRLITISNKNNVYILNDDLKIIGKAEDILRGDEINSVRFIKEFAYLITNRNTDPTFVLDLSNPNNPKEIGKRNLLGFTSYLCPYSDTKLIGVGIEEKTIKSSQGNEVPFTDGIKLSFFDFSDQDNPVELKFELIGGIGTSSKALYDSKSFLFSKDKNIVAFPITLYENNSVEEFSAGVVSYIGYYIYSLDDNGNYVYKGRITHCDKLPDFSNTDGYSFRDSIGYEIRRGVIVDDVLYTISEKMIKANSLSDLNELGKIELKK